MPPPPVPRNQKKEMMEIVKYMDGAMEFEAQQAKRQENLERLRAYR